MARETGTSRSGATSPPSFLPPLTAFLTIAGVSSLLSTALGPSPVESLAIHFPQPKEKRANQPHRLLRQFTTTSGVTVDPYAVLGVDKDAGRSEFRESYCRLSRLLHPDGAPQSRLHSDGSSRPCDDREEEERREQWERVRLSYEILSNEKLRRRYDRNVIAVGIVEDPAAIVGDAVKSVTDKVSNRVEEFRNGFLREVEEKASLALEGPWKAGGEVLESVGKNTFAALEEKASIALEGAGKVGGEALSSAGKNAFAVAAAIAPETSNQPHSPKVAFSAEKVGMAPEGGVSAASTPPIAVSNQPHSPNVAFSAEKVGMAPEGGVSVASTPPIAVKEDQAPRSSGNEAWGVTTTGMEGTIVAEPGGDFNGAAASSPLFGGSPGVKETSSASLLDDTVDDSEDVPSQPPQLVWATANATRKDEAEQATQKYKREKSRKGTKVLTPALSIRNQKKKGKFALLLSLIPRRRFIALSLLLLLLHRVLRAYRGFGLLV